MSMPTPRSEITRHLTATTFVIHSGSVLLHLHPKQRLWLPPGGHVERDELPDDAARREVLEETGLEVQLHSEDEAAALSRELTVRVVAQPAHILVEDINPYHQHVDMIYYALAPTGTIPDVGVRQGFRWMAPDDLPSDAVPPDLAAGIRLALAWAEDKS
ncbi:MAG TPA: NUDIX domain-containing protein [Chloroflexota bacterium]|nr:NUDIX domain-containing protein [Chloroflexota bacterium]